MDRLCITSSGKFSFWVLVMSFVTNFYKQIATSNFFLFLLVLLGIKPCEVL